MSRHERHDTTDDDSGRYPWTRCIGPLWTGGPSSGHRGHGPGDGGSSGGPGVRHHPRWPWKDTTWTMDRQWKDRDDMTDYRITDYPSGRRVIRHRSGLVAVMDRRTGEYVHGVRPVYDGWMDTMEWMDDDDSGHDGHDMEGHDTT